MDPHAFRCHLRKIIAHTARMSAIAGTALAVSCSINVVKGPTDWGQADGSQEVVFDGLPKDGSTTPKDTKGIDATSNPDRSIPKDNCPLIQAAKCQGGNYFRGIYHRLLTTNDPDPLSKSDCLTLCQQELDRLCTWITKDDDVQIGVFDNQCEEDLTPENKRRMVCEYEITQRCPVAGRRPAGLDEATTRQAPQTPLEEVGTFFADMAFLEDAAVTAFQYLTEELRAYQAPTALIEMAHKAIDEEREHVELMTALAQRYGATPQRATAAPFQLRPLTDIAIENAREGCVRESFGSLLGFWQALTSEDPAVRGVMDRIAYEESQHGALSWAIDEWLRPKLHGSSLDQYQQAHAQSIAVLQRENQEEPSEAMRRLAGFPTSSQAQALFSQLVT